MSKLNRKKSKAKAKRNKNKNVSLDNTAEGFIENVKNSNKYKNSLVYLDNFANSRENWKFNKNTQYILLKYVLNKELYDQKQFRIFRKYMKTMSESTRKGFVERCLKYVEEYKEDKLVVVEGRNFREKELEDLIKAVWNKRATKIIEKFL